MRIERQCPGCGCDREQYEIGEWGHRECTACNWRESPTATRPSQRSIMRIELVKLVEIARKSPGYTVESSDGSTLTNFRYDRTPTGRNRRHIAYCDIVKNGVSSTAKFHVPGTVIEILD